MSLIPHFFGDRRRSTATFDPFSLDLFDPFPSFPSLSSSSSSFLNARVDWRETPSSHVFKADVPGLRKEELTVEVEDGRILQISGERKLEKEEKDETWHRIERSSGKFVRRFRLPENAKVEEVRAKMDDGVLTVTVPKVEVKRENVRAVTIDG